jgi:hypothetical protein
VIGKTALALAAAAAIAAAAALFVWAAGFSLYFVFEKSLGPAAAAAIVAAVDALILGGGFLIAYLLGRRKEEAEKEEEEGTSLVTIFADAIKDRPVVTLLMSAVTGFAAVRNPQLFRDLLGDLLRAPKD